MNTLKPVKVRIAFGSYKVGDIINPTALYRDSLMARGLVEKIEEPAQPVVDESPRIARARKVRV